MDIAIFSLWHHLKEVLAMLDVRSRNLVQNHMTNNQFCQTQTPQERHGREVLHLEIQDHHHFSKFNSKTNIYT